MADPAPLHPTRPTDPPARPRAGDRTGQVHDGPQHAAVTWTFHTEFSDPGVPGTDAASGTRPRTHSTGPAERTEPAHDYHLLAPGTDLGFGRQPAPTAATARLVAVPHPRLSGTAVRIRLQHDARVTVSCLQRAARLRISDNSGETRLHLVQDEGAVLGYDATYQLTLALAPAQTDRRSIPTRLSLLITITTPPAPRAPALGHAPGQPQVHAAGTRTALSVTDFLPATDLSSWQLAALFALAVVRPDGTTASPTSAYFAALDTYFERPSSTASVYRKLTAALAHLQAPADGDDKPVVRLAREARAQGLFTSSDIAAFRDTLTARGYTP